MAEASKISGESKCSYSVRKQETLNGDVTKNIGASLKNLAGQIWDN